MKIVIGISVGRDRLALLMPTFGIVLKFPRIRLWIMFREIIGLAKRGRWPMLRNRLRRPPIYEGSCQRDLFGGVIANWSEFWFFFVTRSPFVQPTYFSLFGLVNLQRYGEPCLLEMHTMRREFERLIGQEYMHDNHHFANPKNFSVVLAKALEHDEMYVRLRLRINDYGSPRTQAVVMLWGHTLFAKFRVRREEGAP